MSVREYLSTFPDTVVAYSGEDVSLHVQALIGWLVLDSSGRSVNVVNIALMPQVERLLDGLDRLIASKRVYLVVIASNKPSSFIAGADILAMFPNTEQSAATTGSQALQSIVSRVEQLPVPTIAAINGPALGAGLELALACDYRLASSDSRVVLGLPEVKLGLLPGSGGTVRLPELVGLREALGMMLQGGNVRADRAVRIGLLDAVIETGDRVEGEHRFWSGVRAFATQQMGKGKRRAGGRQRKAGGGVRERLMDGTWAGQWMVAAMAARSLDKQTRGRYPAPYFALDSAVQSAAGLSRKQALELEAQYFGKLAVTPESKALMALFFLMEESKKRKEKTGNAPIIKVRQRSAHSGRIPRSAALRTADQSFLRFARQISRVAVIGAGVMGGQIAALLASKRLTVYIRDIQQAAVDKALQQVQQTFQSRVSKGRLKAAQAAQLTALVTGGTELQPLSQVELVVEAAVEILELKKRILRECEAVMPPHALFATNTSSLSITALAAESTRPQQLLGLHFFNPVQRMPLVEIVRHSGTAASTVASAYQHVLDIGKIPVICNDGPGFIVNRLLGIYMTEAGHLVMEGASVKQVDDAMLGFGMPVGPFRLMDEVGLDVVQHVAPVLEEGLGPRFRAVPEFSQLLKANPKMLGKKTGSGFYLYDEVSAAPAARAQQPPLSQPLTTVCLLPVHWLRAAWEGERAQPIDG